MGTAKEMTKKPVIMLRPTKNAIPGKIRYDAPLRFCFLVYHIYVDLSSPAQLSARIAKSHRHILCSLNIETSQML